MSVTKDDAYLKRLLAYTQERFPIVSILLFVFLFCFNSFSLGELLVLKEHGPFFTSMKVVASLVMFFLFFHLRLLDEFKDYKEDCRAHPERLLSKGVVTLVDLLKVVLVVFILEFLLNIYLGGEIFISFILVFTYSLLMFREFFIREVLKKSLALYLISHQLILPMMVYYLVLTAVSPMPVIFNQELWGVFFIVGLPSFIYEIGRKTWNKEREHQDADSYTKVWGIPATLAVLGLAVIFHLMTHLYLIKLFALSIYGLGLHGVVAIFIFYTIFKFYRNPDLKNSKMVELGVTVMLLAGHIATLLGAYLR